MCEGLRYQQRKDLDKADQQYLLLQPAFVPSKILLTKKET